MFPYLDTFGYEPYPLWHVISRFLLCLILNYSIGRFGLVFRQQYKLLDEVVVG